VPARRNVPRLSFIDVLLLLMTLIWGTNYSIVKRAFAQIDPQAFNAGRMLLASTVFLAIIVAVRARGAAGARLSSFFVTGSPWPASASSGTPATSSSSSAVSRAPAWPTVR
jgi:drug/metabolite transporter (DMT)-like permease